MEFYKHMKYRTKTKKKFLVLEIDFLYNRPM